MKDRLAEMRQGINQRLEGVRTGVNQFLHDERGRITSPWLRYPLRFGVGSAIIGLSGLATGEASLYAIENFTMGFRAAADARDEIRYLGMLAVVLVGTSLGMVAGSEVAVRFCRRFI